MLLKLMTMDNDISAKTTWVDLGGLIYGWGGGGVG